MEKQRYDLLAVALLVFSGVIVATQVSSPTTFRLQEWQTLMASFVALGAATLAYNAAMAKVEYDKQAATEAEKRRITGLFLRVGFAARELQHEAEVLKKRLNKPEKIAAKNFKSDAASVGDFPDPMEEAWNEIATFPREIAASLSAIRVALYNLKIIESFKPVSVISIPAIGPDNRVIVLLTDATDSIIDECKSIRRILKEKLQASGMHFREPI